MQITYKDQKEFTPDQLEALFRSVGWASAKYPERLAQAMRGSSRVLSAWDGERLIGLVRSLDDGCTAAFIHYLLVRPDYQNHHICGTLLSKLLEGYRDYLYVKIMPSAQNTVPFYEKYGFRIFGNYCAMQIERL